MGLETPGGPRRPCHMEALLVGGPGDLGTWNFPWRQGLQLVSMAVGDTAARKWIKICINSFEAMSLATSARPIGLFRPGLLGMTCRGHSYALLALQVAARSDLTLSIATVSGMERDAEARWLIWSQGMPVSFRPLVPRIGVGDLWATL